MCGKFYGMLSHGHFRCIFYINSIFAVRDLKGPENPGFSAFFDNFIRIILTLHMAYDRIIFVKVWNIAVLTNF